MRRTLVFIAIFVAGVAFGIVISGWFDVDTCLDAGGRWNYDRLDCEY